MAGRRRAAAAAWFGWEFALGLSIGTVLGGALIMLRLGLGVGA